MGLVLFIIVSSGFTALGIYLLRHMDAATAFFEGRGASLFGPRVAHRVYRPANVRVGALALAVIGPLFVVIGLTRLVAAVVPLFA